MADFFIKRPIMAIVIAIVMVLAGLVVMKNLPIAQFPDIVPPEIQVTTTYTGADAVTIEQSVATPLEQQMNGVDNMLYMRSTNANDGTMTLKVTFEVGTNVDTDQVLVQNRVTQASANLPSQVNQFGVTVKKSMGLPLLVVSVFSPDGSRDSTFLGNYATINLNDQLLRIPGVGQITNFGAADYAMRIWVRPDILTQRNITVNEIIDAVQRQNTVNPSGQVGGEPAPKGQQFTYTVRSQGRLVNAEEFGDIIVRTNPDGSTLRLKDVARLELGGLNYLQIGRFNHKEAKIDQKPAGVICIYQAPGSNALAVAEQVKKALEELKGQFPSGVEYDISLDTTLPVTEGINEILHTLFEAIILVLIVVFLFLQNWRATLIPLIAVPVSLIGTFAVFPLLGFSINTLSLFGLILAIGLVVDDAIVVVEAVEHHIEHGMTPTEATIQAMKEVSGPVIGIALILTAVFVPVAFMKGIVGRLNQQFAVTIAVSVLISAFNALTLSPALAAMLLRPRKKSTGWLGRFFDGFNRWFDRMTAKYVGGTSFMVKKSIRSLILLGGLSGVALFLGAKLPTGFVPEEDQGYFFLNVQLPDAASLQRTDAVCKRIDQMMNENEDIRSLVTISGYSLISGTSASYQAFYFVALKPWEERKGKEHSARTIIQKLNKELAEKVVEAKAFAFPPPAIPGIGNAGGITMLLQDKSGGSVEFLAQNMAKFVEAATKRPEIAGVQTVWRPAVPQIFANVNKDQVLKQGVNLTDVYTTLQANLGGFYTNQFNRFGRQWKVFLQAEPEFRTKQEDIGQFNVRNKTGGMVPLGALLSTDKMVGPQNTDRHNLFRAVELNVAVKPGFSTGQAITALEAVAKESLPREMTYDYNGMTYQEKKAGGSAAIFIMSFTFVFLILAAMYESWSLPFSVLLTAPLAMLGAYLGLFGRGFDNNVYAQIGLVMLIGLAAKNAILIVEFAKLEHEKGRDLVEATLDGAKLRLRPILMTSFAFILGCVPLAIASGAGAAGRQIMGTAVIMGMIVVTGIGIFIVPVLYVVVERMFAKKTPPATPGAPDAPHGGH